jgi:osmotically inducible lipoprotein OsmB
MTPRSGIAIAVATLLLAGCGTSTGDRAISGGAIGAAGGAVIGSLVGAPLAGAALGGAGGAAIGGLTSPSDVDLGKPIWKR